MQTNPSSLISLGYLTAYHIATRNVVNTAFDVVNMIGAIGQNVRTNLRYRFPSAEMKAIIEHGKPHHLS